MKNKYGTRLVDKKTGESRILAITNAKMLSDNYIISQIKDEFKRKKFAWKPMSTEWKENCQKRWWFRKEKEPYIDPKLYELREKLLSFGGEATCLPGEEEDIDDILNSGQFWFGSESVMLKGEPCNCHRNACALYQDNIYGDMRICTGYALSNDGMWRQHSWLVLHQNEENIIIETTEPRIAYFGFVMSKKQCEKFCSRILY